METACGIEDNHLVAVVSCVLYSFLCDGHRIYLTHLKDLYSSLFSHNLQLIDSCGTVNVAGCKQWTLALILEILGKLCGMSCFTRALETYHHNDAGRLAGVIYAGIFVAHESDKLFVNYFYYLLCRCETCKNISSHSSFGNLTDKVLNDLVAYVSLKQSHFDLTHSFLNVSLGENAPALQAFEYCV